MPQIAGLNDNESAWLSFFVVGSICSVTSINLVSELVTVKHGTHAPSLSVPNPPYCKSPRKICHKPPRCNPATPQPRNLASLPST